MHVDVTVRGVVPAGVAREAVRKVAALERIVKGPVAGARVVLISEANPSISLAARAEGEIVLAGHAVRARVAARDMWQAVDELTERLRERLRDHVERLITRQRAGAAPGPGEWRHGAWAPSRPPHAWRPAAERRLVRRKTFAVRPLDVHEALAELEALDHSFYLYRDTDAGADVVVHRRDDGRYGVIVQGGAPGAPETGPVVEPNRHPTPMGLAAATGEMDALDHRFLFFTDARSGRGAVLYLRYDGHYGLIESAATDAAG